MCRDLRLYYANNIRWIPCLSPSSSCLWTFTQWWMFVSACCSSYCITQIFITPASKSRQTDDKHACGWVSFLWFEIHHTRTHTPLCALVMLFMTEISCRHRLFLTDCCLMVLFVVLLDSATATYQWRAALIRATKTYFSDTSLWKPFVLPCLCLPQRYFAHSAHLQIELNFTVCCFHNVVLLHRLLMIAHEMELLFKDGSAITPVLCFRYFTLTFYLCLSQQSFLSRTLQDINVKLLWEAFPFLWPLERLYGPATPIM